jgi:hypothetical protein
MMATKGLVRFERHFMILLTAVNSDGHIRAADGRVIRLQQRNKHRLLCSHLHGAPQFADGVAVEKQFLQRNAQADDVWPVFGFIDYAEDVFKITVRAGSFRGRLWIDFDVAEYRRERLYRRRQRQQK